MEKGRYRSLSTPQEFYAWAIESPIRRKAKSASGVVYHIEIDSDGALRLIEKDRSSHLYLSARIHDFPLVTTEDENGKILPGTMPPKPPQSATFIVVDESAEARVLRVFEEAILPNLKIEGTPAAPRMVYAKTK